MSKSLKMLLAVLIATAVTLMAGPASAGGIPVPKVVNGNQCERIVAVYSMDQATKAHEDFLKKCIKAGLISAWTIKGYGLQQLAIEAGQNK